MEVTEELEHQVSLIVQQEAAKGLVEGVYLFGSQVRGNAIVDSDLDVAVIISDESKLSQIDYGRLYNLFSDVFSGIAKLCDSLSIAEGNCSIPFM